MIYAYTGHRMNMMNVCAFILWHILFSTKEAAFTIQYNTD